LIRLFLTGRPGIGKTSVLLQVVDALTRRELKLGGFVSHEVREHGLRVGFAIVDIATRRKGWLAHVNQAVGPSISKYRVNMIDLNRIGTTAILTAIEEADVIVIDEIGPMELVSSPFQEAVKNAMATSKPIIGTIHRRARDPLIFSIKSRQDVALLEVTLANRITLSDQIVRRVLQFTR
jgi:nucleoside-triphosphatase